MTLVQKTINGTEYYTDNEVYYTFHQVKLATDTLWDFACLDLGITKKMRFTSQEIKAITDLAGIGPHHPTKFLLLENGTAIPVPFPDAMSAVVFLLGRDLITFIHKLNDQQQCFIPL